MIISEKTKKISLCESGDPFEDIFEDLEQRKKRHKISTGVPIYFYRYIGVDDTLKYLERMKKVGKRLINGSSNSNHYSNSNSNSNCSSRNDNGNNRMQHSYLIITNGIDKHVTQDEAEILTRIWLKLQDWYENSSRNEVDLYNLQLDDRVGFVNWEYKKNLVKVMEIFDSVEKNVSSTIRKNFIVLLLSWSSKYLHKLLSKDKFECENPIPKILYYGQIKKNEVYFLIFASFFGCDVIYINPAEDNEFLRIDSYNKFSCIKYLSSRAAIGSINNPFLHENVLMENHQIIDESKKMPVVDENTVNEKNINTLEPLQRTYKLEQEKNYEELAGLSASVVMINIYKHDFFVGGIGSGVVIDDNGLILTNYHVVKDGGIFGVVFENDEHEYISHKLLEFDEKKDMALFRIDLKTTPIPVKRDNNLKRGQQIVAIGSPLGLMNTISDGIIAGFRKINELEYIQITAPISPGSSGGALIDKYGYLIGITTAGFTDGQNLNLAVPISELSKLGSMRHI